MVHKYKNGNGERRRSRSFSSLHSHVPVKALSVNRAYTGRKRKSVWLKGYQTQVMRQLPEGSTPDKGNLSLTITFGVSNRASDLDNLLKPFIDILQNKFGFNDRQIYYIQAYKKLVAKGSEYINWKINKYRGEIDER